MTNIVNVRDICEIWIIVVCLIVLLTLLSLHTQATKDTSCESVVTSGQHNNMTSQHPPRDASPAGWVGLMGPWSFSYTGLW
jgi:hypothetical protein